MRALPFLAIVLMSALALAGCGESKPIAGGNVGAAASGAPDAIEAQINEFDEVRRKQTFFRAILDAEFTCKKVMTVQSKPRDNGRPVWLVTCDDGGEYRVTLQPGGVMNVSGVKQANRLRFPKATSTPDAVKAMLK